MKTPARVSLDGRELERLELMLSGLLPGATGYVLPGAEEGSSLRIGVERGVKEGDSLELTDGENTPIATVQVQGAAPADPGYVWVAGPVRKLRDLEHGPVRDVRLSGDENFGDAVTAIFSPSPRPAAILSAVNDAGGKRLVLVAYGCGDRARDSELVQDLSEAAEFIPRAEVWFIPEFADPDDPDNEVQRVLEGLGARQIRDFRHARSQAGAGAVMLFTGLSGSGKSTIARAVADRLSVITDRGVSLLDGDHVRRALASELGFSAEDRHTNLVRQAWVAARVAEVGGLAICAPIAPFAASRSAMRDEAGSGSVFLTIYVSTPLEVAEARDRKGLYARARAGLIPDFTGIDSPYEVPTDADLAIDASVLTVEECVEGVIELLDRSGLL